MQTFQMAILLLFEATDALTCKEIKETLQLNNEHFHRHAVSLVEAKLLIPDTEVRGVPQGYVLEPVSPSY